MRENPHVKVLVPQIRMTLLFILGYFASFAAGVSLVPPVIEPRPRQSGPRLTNHSTLAGC